MEQCSETIRRTWYLIHKLISEGRQVLGRTVAEKETGLCWDWQDVSGKLMVVVDIVGTARRLAVSRNDG